MTKLTLADGRQTEVVDVGIVDEKTPWCTFKLEDGTTLKIRLNLVSVARAEEIWNQANGNPIYIHETNLTVRVSAPKKLKAQSVGKKGKPKAGMEVA